MRFPKYSVYYVMVVLVWSFACTKKNNNATTQQQSPGDSSSHIDIDYGKSTAPIRNASDYIIPNNTYKDWQADTLETGAEDYALMVYSKGDSVDLNNLLGRWVELTFDDARRCHVLYQPCDAGIEEYEFRMVGNDSTSEKKLQMTWFAGQISDDYNLTTSSNQGVIRLSSGANQLEVNFNYAFNWWRVGGLWHYPNTAVFNVIEGWGRTGPHLFVRKSESEVFETVNQQPCEH